MSAHTDSRVAISCLRPADSPRVDGEDIEHIRMLAQVTDPLPPILVHRDTMRVIDGMHRLRAARLRGDDEIDVWFFDGTADDAFLLAIRANATHGLPLTKADRQAAVRRVFARHPSWSDRRVARATGLAVKTVSAIRRCSTEDAPQLNNTNDGRVGADGRVRPLCTAAARRRAGELIAARPDTPLREIATAAGVSVGTARDVRERIREGRDPVPEQVRALESRRTGPRSASASAGQPVAGLRAHLRADPSVRLTEAGRELLRWLETYCRPPASWSGTLSSLPPHCHELVARIARDNAAQWNKLANQLEHTAHPGVVNAD